MLKVGITGGIGSGKSVVTNIFQVLGIPIYDADTEAKKLYDENAELKQNIIAYFGDDLYVNHHFDKKKMADIVFHDSEKLQMLNSLVHPLLNAHAEKWMQQQTTKYAIKEAALLIESGSYKQLDKIIFVSCPLETRILRVMQRDNASYDDVLNRIKKQLPDEEKRKHADFEIVNDNKQLLIPQVLKIHEELLQIA